LQLAGRKNQVIIYTADTINFIIITSEDCVPFFTANPSKVDRNAYYCDRNLLLSLVFDAKVTEWFANLSTTLNETG
jgi:hypothetical protein